MVVRMAAMTVAWMVVRIAATKGKTIADLVTAMMESALRLVTHCELYVVCAIIRNTLT